MQAIVEDATIMPTPPFEEVCTSEIKVQTASQPLLRAVIYATYAGLLFALIFAGITRPIEAGRSPLFQEGSFVETLQSFHVAVATTLFASLVAQEFRQPRADRLGVRWMAVIFMLGTAFALHRELDFVWKRAGYDWQYHALKVVIALPGVVVLIKHFRPLLVTWLAKPNWPPFLLLYVAIGGYAVAQLVPKALEPLGVPYLYLGVVEEGMELLAGLWFVVAAVELIARRQCDPA